MNYKALFGVIGCGLMVGTVVYAVAKHLNKDVSINLDDEPIKDKKVMANETEMETEKNTVEDAMGNLDVTITEKANLVNERHKEAAKIMKESLGEVLGESDVQGEHKEEFDNILNDLDILTEEI